MYGGYCFFNNAAVAAHHVASTTGSRVTVLDVDYHHGNGTQQIFYDRDDVQYVSLHGDPVRAYPYLTGFADESGTGRGRGANLNVPLAARLDDDGYLIALGDVCAAIDAFDPAVVVVSLGLDTYHADPISDLGVTTDGFRRQGALVGELGRPTVVLQEGGYDVATLGLNAREFLLGLGRSSYGRIGGTDATVDQLRKPFSVSQSVATASASSSSMSTRRLSSVSPSVVNAALIESTSACKSAP